MHDPIIFARSQEPSIRLSCIQLLKYGCVSNVMKAGRQAFQETSVRRIFIESCDMQVLKSRCIQVPAKTLLICFS